MGNAVISPASCFNPSPKSNHSSAAKLVLYDGTSRALAGKKRIIAGEFMFEFPDSMVCHADSFFLGQPVPALGIHDELRRGETYFLLPIDPFACGVLSASSLASFGAANSPTPSPSPSPSPSPNSHHLTKPMSPINFGTTTPFEYVKGSNGRVMIKVSAEFIESLIMRGKDQIGSPSSGGGGFLCNTPELKKHYEQLVGSKEQVWSPKLETISEHKIRFSPCRFIGLEWKIKEGR